MGNIEIRPRRRTASIFGHRTSKSRSPFRDVLSPNSPFYQDYSPIKYSGKPNRSPHLKQVPKSPPPNNQKFFRCNSKSGRRDNQEYSQNREKCDEIIRKVRNFNDFLVELKRRLREDCSWREASQVKEKGEVSMSVKLQNEKVELEKYKKLVQRELSKTHSIENITISQAQSGEKILTIQYEQQDRIQNEQQEKQFKVEETLSQDEPNTSRSVQQLATTLEEDMALSHKERLRQAKILWQVLRKRTEQLGKMLEQQQTDSPTDGSLKDYMRSKEQAVRADQLLMALQQANRQSMEAEQRIRSLLN